MSLKRQTLWSMAPLLAVTAVNLVSVPLFYRFLGAELYALWFYVLTFTGAFGFMDLGLGVAVGRYIGVALGRDDQQAVREYWGTGNAIAIPLLALMGFLFALIGAMFGPLWFNVSPALVGMLRWSFIAGGVSLFLSYYCQFWLILSQAHLDFKFISILRTGISLLQVVPSIGLAWATRSPLILILWATATAALQLVIFIWHAKKSYRLDLSIHHGLGASARDGSLHRQDFRQPYRRLISRVRRSFGFGEICPAGGFHQLRDLHQRRREDCRSRRRASSDPCLVIPIARLGAEIANR